MRFLLIPLFISCDLKTDEDGADTADTANSSQAEPDTAQNEWDTAQMEEVAWWRLSGQLIITKGRPGIKKSTLSLTLLTEKLKPVCTETLLLTEVIEESQPHKDVYVWWQLTSGEGDGGCEGRSLPDEPLLLGIGTMHSDILPGLQSNDDIADPTALNGAYASLDDGETLLVFGAAGLAETWISGGEPAKAAPLADGIWLIKPVYTFVYVK